MDSVYGDMNKLCATISTGPNLDAAGNTLVTFKVATTDQGKHLEKLLESGVEMGVSQRALGCEEVRTFPPEDGSSTSEEVELSVVTDIAGIYGYDFVHLDAANAGDATRVRRVSDSVLAASNPLSQDGKTMLTDAQKAAAAEADKERIASDTARDAAVAALTDSVTKLSAQVLSMSERLEKRAIADGSPAAKTVADSAKAMKAAVEALMADSAVSVEKRNEQLTAISLELQDAFSKFTGTPVDAKAVAQLDSLKATSKATATLADAMRTMMATNDTQSRVAQLTTKFNELVDSVGGEGFSADDKISLKKKLSDKIGACADEAAVKSLIEDAVEMVNMGRAKERLVQLGYKEKPSPSTSAAQEEISVIDTSGDRSHLQYASFLADKMIQTNSWKPMLDVSKGKTREGKDLHPGLANVLACWDKRNAVHLRRELADAMKAGGGRLSDATLHADFETPYTLARLVLFEAYANEIILGITSFGTMENDRDQVPITKWRRSSTGRKTFKPNMKERSELQVGELASIPEGRMTTEFFPIDAKARKLRAVLSDEFITRAKRRPDITGVAMASQNLVDDVRRSLEQDIFFEMIRGALLTDAVAFTSAQNGDGVAFTFQVTHNTNQVGAIAIDADTAVTIVPGTLTVEIGSAIIPEWGTSSTGGGPGAAYFYLVDHALGLITFVDANAAALPPPVGTGTVKVVAGKKAGGLSAGRFNLNAGSVEQEIYMNKLLFKIMDLGAALPTNTGFSPDMIVQSRTLATTLQQAKAYTPLAKRRAFNGDGPVVDGNFGITADLAHFASSIFPSAFTVVGRREATLFRVFEPLTLRGPMETRDVDGKVNGGKEWYSYQEDSIAVPLAEKLALITTYTK
ncbi:hypothetical protein KW797_01940 [Candidatus Parcubacteria bacterium]|nr:hypothetical protein [Candidatus Parcubacteria bacterium]